MRLGWRGTLVAIVCVALLCYAYAAIVFVGGAQAIAPDDVLTVDHVRMTLSAFLALILAPLLQVAPLARISAPAERIPTWPPAERTAYLLAWIGTGLAMYALGPCATSGINQLAHVDSHVPFDRDSVLLAGAASIGLMVMLLAAGKRAFRGIGLGWAAHLRYRRFSLALGSIVFMAYPGFAILARFAAAS